MDSDDDDRVLFDWLEVLASSGGFHDELPEHQDLDRVTRLKLTQVLLRRNWIEAKTPGGHNLAGARHIRVLPAGERALAERRSRPRGSGSIADGASLHEKRERRLQFTKVLYDITGGSRAPIVDMYNLGSNLGWQRPATANVVDYLEGEGLVEFRTAEGAISITHRGIVEVEEALGHPERPTEHFAPAVNVIHIGTMLDSQILQGSPSATQTSNIVKASTVGPALDLIREIRSTVLPDLILDADDRAELEVELQTAELQLALPTPKTGRVKESLGRVAEILATASVVGGSAVQLAQQVEKLHQLLPGF